MDINDLPVEIFTDILLKTDGKTIGTCRRVCKQWKQFIDNSEYLWEKISNKDFPYASRIAKEKSHSACKWHHLYRNLANWNHVNLIKNWVVEHTEFEYPLVEFIHSLNVKLKISKYRRLTFANNEHALILFYNLTLGIIRPVDNEEYKAERYIPAMGFSLYGDKVYFYNERDVFMCDLLSAELETTCIHHCDYNIIEIQHFDGQTHLFTSCGNIVTLSQDNVTKKPIHCPPQWRDQIKHVCAINNRNYIFYSTNLFNIETQKNRHLYMDFVPVTAVFYYEVNVLIADFKGNIWLYRPREQKFASKPIMEPITVLPEGYFATHLDVFERKSGTVIIATTSQRIFLITMTFFPEDTKDDDLPLVIKRMQMYKRVLENRVILKTQNMGVFHKATA